MKNVFLTTALLLLAGDKSGLAQDTTISTMTKPPVGGWLVGVSVGVPGYRDAMVPEAFTVGFSVTDIRPRRVGADFSFVVLPRAMSEGVVLAATRLNAAIAIPLTPNLMALPSAGISAIGGVGGGSMAGWPGLNAGFSTLYTDSSLGIRTGVTLHYFPLIDEPVWQIEIGFTHLPNVGTYRTGGRR